MGLTQKPPPIPGGLRCATCDGDEEALVLIDLTENLHEGMGEACARAWVESPERRHYRQLMDAQGGVYAVMQYRDFQARMAREKRKAA